MTLKIVITNCFLILFLALSSLCPRKVVFLGLVHFTKIPCSGWRFWEGIEFGLSSFRTGILRSSFLKSRSKSLSLRCNEQIRAVFGFISSCLLHDSIHDFWTEISFGNRKYDASLGDGQIATEQVIVLRSILLQYNFNCLKTCTNLNSFFFH